MDPLLTQTVVHALPDEPDTILWLYGVARNVIANGDRTRRRQGRLAEKLRSQLGDVFEVLPVPDPALAAQVTAAMKSLTPVEREVLTLTATEQLSPAEIAVVLDMKQNTARTHLHRARNKLRAALTTDAPQNSAPRTKRIDGAGHERTERQSLRFDRTQGAQ